MSHAGVLAAAVLAVAVDEISMGVTRGGGTREGDSVCESTKSWRGHVRGAVAHTHTHRTRRLHAHPPVQSRDLSLASTTAWVSASAPCARRERAPFEGQIGFG
jgi:hypothetical protein